MLHSIVYVSTAVHPMNDAELEALLVEARGLNFETQVSGVLLYSGGNFMQCFEGTDDAVAITYQRIRKSRRHTGLIELVDEPVTARSFEAWEMGFKRASDSALLQLSSARWQRQVDASGPAPDSPGMTLLKHFWSQAGR